MIPLRWQHGSSLPSYLRVQPTWYLVILVLPFFAKQLCLLGCDNRDRLAVICPMEDTKCWDCTGESRIKLIASTFSWSLNKAGWNDTGVKTKTKQLQAISHLVSDWLLLHPRESIVKPAIPQSPAVLEMLNFKGKTALGWGGRMLWMWNDCIRN